MFKGLLKIDSLLRTLQDRAQFLCEHHVALDLQLASHEGLHAIELPCCHSLKVCWCQCDRNVCLVLAPLDSARTVLQVNMQLIIADDQLEHSTTLLHKFSALRLDSCFDLFENCLGHVAKGL